MEKRGRPLKEDAKRKQFRIRMTDEQAEMLNFTSERLGVSKTDVILKALNIQYNLAKKRQ